MKSTKKIIVSVISDLVTDQRVHRTALTLHQMGFDVTLVGRELRKSLPMDVRPYKTKRFSLLFETGILFYIEYHVRLFLFLLLNRCDLLFSNDLDTLLPNYLASKIYGSSVIYDSHEYFTEVPELQNNRGKKKIWKKIESSIFPNLKYTITVNDSIAELFQKEYEKRPAVIRNLPINSGLNKVTDVVQFKKENEFPLDKKIIILQGAGINIQRGAEEAVEAMRYIDNAVFLIIGGGDVYPKLLELSGKFELQDKIIFIPRVPYSDLVQFTQVADVGLTLDKNTNINYRFSLPNKIFDYINAGIPVIASDLPEIKKIIKQYDIGVVLNEVTPASIANAVKQLFNDPERYNRYKENTLIAASELNWDVERKKLESLINTIFAGT